MGIYGKYMALAVVQQLSPSSRMVRFFGCMVSYV